MISVCASTTTFCCPSESFRPTPTQAFQNIQPRIKSLDLEDSPQKKDALRYFLTNYVQSRERGHERMVMVWRKREQATGFGVALRKARAPENVKASVLAAMVVCAQDSSISLRQSTDFDVGPFLPYFLSCWLSQALLSFG